MTRPLTVTIVSDLHLGGDPGFRMMTEPARLAAFIEDITARDPATDKQELVINGDFVDFLSETHGTNEQGEPLWEPFIEDPGRARECFRKIAAGMDAPVFDALAALLERGHRLTVLLGNHDVELCLPAVRQALLERLGVRAGHDLDFRYDGEGYVIGNALVEHGNRYDESNFIDHERLHNLRVKQSLRQDQPAKLPFAPPLGSFFVARAMNKIKKKHAFVDLLKPEGPALVALLLAIDPELRDAIAVMVKLAREHKSRHSEATDAWSEKTVFRGSRSPRSVDGDLTQVLGEALGDDVLEDLPDAVVRGAEAQPRMRGGAKRGGVSETWELLGEGGWEVIRLIGGGRRQKQVKRLELLRRAVRKLGASPAFTRDTDEPDSPYLAAARELAWSEEHPDGFRFVIFGHTHHAKDIALDDHGTRYLNSGTWANVMSFPAPLFDPTTDEQRATDVLRGFLDDLEQGELVPHVRFEPTYVRLSLAADGNVHEAKVEAFRGGPSRPASP